MISETNIEKQQLPVNEPRIQIRFSECTEGTRTLCDETTGNDINSIF